MKVLTARFIESIKPAQGQRLEFTDHEIRGLTFRVTGKGAKTWLLRYRLNSGERRKLTIGSYPPVGLADARAKATIALGKVAQGQDPAREKAREARTAKTNRLTKPATVSDLWRYYDRAHLAQKRPHTQTYGRWLWIKHLEPRLGPVRLNELDRHSIKAVVRDIGATAPTTANKALSTMRHMLNVAVEEEFLQANPLAGLGNLFEEKSRERVLNDNELRTFWSALRTGPQRTDLPVSERICLALQFTLATAARGGEVIGLHAREIDVEARSWTIPSDRTKSGRAHTIPLSPLAWNILVQAFRTAPTLWACYAFPMRGNDTRPMERASMTRAMNKICRAYGIARATPHDLRRTAATYMASERIGIAPHVLTALLGHAADGARVTQVYNRHRYDSEKRQALEAWAAVMSHILHDTNSPPSSR